MFGIFQFNNQILIFLESGREIPTHNISHNLGGTFCNKG